MIGREPTRHMVAGYIIQAIIINNSVHILTVHTSTLRLTFSVATTPARELHARQLDSLGQQPLTRLSSALDFLDSSGARKLRFGAVGDSGVRETQIRRRGGL
eukprot:1182893-Prorocentrum_minimum.AAC.1